jgi:hypothetical protein
MLDSASARSTSETPIVPSISCRSTMPRCRIHAQDACHVSHACYHGSNVVMSQPHDLTLMLS